MKPIEQVHEGMKVVDAEGNEVGSVEEMKMGDPQAVTDQGQTNPQAGGLLTSIVSAFAADSQVPEERAERLLRVGYVKIDNKGIFAGDRFVPADELDRVEEDTLWLKTSTQG